MACWSPNPPEVGREFLAKLRFPLDRLWEAVRSGSWAILRQLPEIGGCGLIGTGRTGSLHPRRPASSSQLCLMAKGSIASVVLVLRPMTLGLGPTISACQAVGSCTARAMLAEQLHSLFQLAVYLYNAYAPSRRPARSNITCQAVKNGLLGSGRLPWVSSWMRAVHVWRRSERRLLVCSSTQSPKSGVLRLRQRLRQWKRRCSSQMGSLLSPAFRF